MTGGSKQNFAKISVAPVGIFIHWVVWLIVLSGCYSREAVAPDRTNTVVETGSESLQIVMRDSSIVVFESGRSVLAPESTEFYFVMGTRVDPVTGKRSDFRGRVASDTFSIRDTSRSTGWSSTVREPIRYYEFKDYDGAVIRTDASDNFFFVRNNGPASLWGSGAIERQGSVKPFQGGVPLSEIRSVSIVKNRTMRNILITAGAVIVIGGGIATAMILHTLASDH